MTLRHQLRALGVPTRRIPLAIPYMFFSPQSVDRNAAGVREIVSAVQGRLRALGFSVRLTGVIDVATTRALDKLIPPAGSFAARSFSDLARISLSATRAHRASLGATPGWEYGRSKANCVGRGATKAVFVRLQKGINRLSSKLGTPRVKTDGIIGKTTVSAARTVASRIYKPASELWTRATCETLANNATKIAESFHQKADALGAPATVKPSSGSGRGSRPATLSSAAASSSSESLLKVAPFVLIAGGVAFLVVSMRGRGT